MIVVFFRVVRELGMPGELALGDVVVSFFSLTSLPAGVCDL